jgi:hypothetical protein
MGDCADLSVSKAGLGMAGCRLGHRGRKSRGDGFTLAIEERRVDRALAKCRQLQHVDEERQVRSHTANRELPQRGREPGDRQVA